MTASTRDNLRFLADTSGSPALTNSLGLAPVRTYPFSILFGDLSTAGLTITVDPTGLAQNGTYPANAYQVCVVHRVPAAFAGPAVSSLLLNVGTVANPNALADSIDLLTATPDAGVVNDNDGVFLPWTHAAAFDLRVDATAIGANLDVLTAGLFEAEVVLYAAAMAPR